MSRAASLPDLEIALRAKAGKHQEQEGAGARPDGFGLIQSADSCSATFTTQAALTLPTRRSACSKRLELGALLHDIGKIGIPSEILAKPGRLTADERAIMETHPELGERIIAPIDRLQDVGAIVRHCHERWDGRGYPDGLAGQDVPLESRIIFVCDAYHAMTTDRPYRKRLSHPEAVRRLRESAGSQFDADVVEIAVTVIERAGTPSPTLT